MRYEKTVQNAEKEPDRNGTASGPRGRKPNATKGFGIGAARGFKVMTYHYRRPADLELHPATAVSVQGWGRCSAHEHIDDSPHGAWRKPAEQLIRDSRRSSPRWPRNGNDSPRKPRARRTITSFEVRNQIPVIE
jgi:hypothetical protein